MRARRLIAVLVAALSLVWIGTSAAPAQPPPPPVLPHPPPIGSTFFLHPDSGPVGTKVTIQGACGFAANLLVYGVTVQNESGFQTIWLPPSGFATLNPTPFGVFSVSFTFPSTGNVPEDFGGQGNVQIVPGTYYVGALCSPEVTPMPFQPFTVTAERR
jgi:hypothetical protein